jgi:N6-adenosine-specific RNA methylase IME4
MPPHTPEERVALREDIAAHGVMVAIEVDEEGATLDGNLRAAIADELGLDCPRHVVRGLNAAEKRERAIKLNLLRRQLGPIGWARLFRQLAGERGVRLGQGQRNDRTSARVADVALELGVPYRTARNRLKLAEDVERYAPDLALAVDRGEIPAEEVQKRVALGRAADMARIISAEATPPPDGRYRVLVVDPLWSWVSDGGGPVERMHATGRRPMSGDEIAALPIDRIAEADAILWLWAPNRHLERAYELVRGWEFAPRTLLTWVRDRVGPGKWLHGRTEHAILATRGRPVVTLTDQTTVLEAQASGGAPPEAFFALVDELRPGSKLAMFGAVHRPGWEVWGDPAPEATQPADSDLIAPHCGEKEGDSAARGAELEEPSSEDWP